MPRKPIPVRAALALINQVLDESLAEQEGDFDADTRWALAGLSKLVLKRVVWCRRAVVQGQEYGRERTCRSRHRYSPARVR